MRLKQGTWKIHHFAHVAGNSHCPKEAESELHATTKLAIFEAARELIPGALVLMEHRTGNRIADVAIMGRRRRVAIEVQLSAIPRKTIAQRTFDHVAAGFTTMWVVDFGEDLRTVCKDSQYKVRAFQCDIHNMFGGFVFVHRSGLDFDYVHLMGWKYQTYKYLKVGYTPINLLETIDRGGFVDLPPEYKWWRRLASEGARLHG